MKIRSSQAFVAYPGFSHELATTITNAANTAESGHRKIIAWPSMNIYGANIPDEIRNNISDSNILFADITLPNLNVYYEIGFAIGKGNAILPTVNASFNGAKNNIKRQGIFSNIGYSSYENSDQLREIFFREVNEPLLELYAADVNFSQPVFLLDTLRKTDFRNSIVSSIKASKAHFRSYDPVENSRISIVQIVSEVSAASGVVVPYLQKHIDGANRHNLIGALIAGLAAGLGREALVISNQHSGAEPTDYNDDIVFVKDESRVLETVEPFCSSAVILAQNITPTKRKSKPSMLQNLSLGASAAENEFRDLGHYFVETSEYLRALRGEVNVITGRKGSGKSAIFFQVRDEGRKHRGSVNVDLKPESHQLSNFREQIISTGGAGIFEHTISAFWYFVIVSETLLNTYKTLEMRSKYDDKVLGPMRAIEDAFEDFKILEPGDFTTRLVRLSNLVADDLKAAVSAGKQLSPAQITNAVFRKAIGKIRDLVVTHTTADQPIKFLFDNIDKGWPPTGVQPKDITIVRLLIETLATVKNDFGVRDRDFQSIVFVRHDVYDLMIDQTSDRGKTGHVSIDWTDRTKLSQVLFRRLQVAFDDYQSSLAQLWGKVFPHSVNGQDSLDFFIDHCIMRPRFLIDVVEAAISNAINRAHGTVDEEDCIDAVRQHSLTLVDDFGFEVRDVSGLSSEIFYEFIGLERLTTKIDLLSALYDGGYTHGNADEVIRLMLWYGLIGVVDDEGGERYVYDYLYNMKRMQIEFGRIGDCQRLTINRALHVGLSS